MKIFILEDDPDRMEVFHLQLAGHEIVHADTAQKAIRILDTQGFDLILLDHDLGGMQMMPNTDTNTGSEVVRWMLTGMQKFPTVIVHSHNPDGGKAMHRDLLAHGVDCHFIPFAKLIFQLPTLKLNE
jgi:CheY-like chemotaxis protein